MASMDEEKASDAGVGASATAVLASVASYIPSSSDMEDGDLDEQKQQHHRHHHTGRHLSTALSRIASNASSAVRFHQQHREEHLAASPVPLSDLDKGIVGWDGVDDPAKPLNFPSRKKWLIIFLLSAMTFMTPFASSILAPSIGFMDADFHKDSLTMGSLAVSIYLLCVANRLQYKYTNIFCLLPGC